jgi:HlyD family secretion protein
MDTALFRKVSLDRLSSPEQIDQLLEVTTARTWIALTALCCTLIAGIVWSVTGSSDDTVAGRGVISRTGGVNVVVAQGTGNILNMHVEVGDAVRAGQVVAQIEQPALEDKLKHAQEQLEEAKEARNSALAERKGSDASRLIALKKQTASMEQEIADTQDQIKWAKEQIPEDAQLVAKGLITKQAALANRQKVASLESDVQKLEAQIAQIQSQRVSMDNDTSQVSLDYDNKISGTVHDIQMMEQDLHRASTVVTPYAGRVVEVASYEGALVGAGQPILSIEASKRSGDAQGSQDLVVYAYVSSSDVKQIKPGMEAHVSPSGFQQEEYGYMLGTVDSVASYPATMEAITHAFENETLARSMTGQGPVTEVRVTLRRNTETRSGYAWSSRNGPSEEITSGSVSTVDIVTRKQRPIELVMPYIKKKLGL